MQDIIDLERYPLDQPESSAWINLVDSCRSALDADGLFNLPAFLRQEAIRSAAAELKPVFDTSSFTHAREHNIYFKDSVAGLEDDHPALIKFKTINHTICADQLQDTLVRDLYEWPPFASFLAAVLGKPELYTMADPLAGVNVMEYRDAEALNWHFDRAEFTTTLLLQSPKSGGVFEYAHNLRSDENPNYEDVAKLVEGTFPTTLMPLEAGTLNVFRGKNTAHRVTPVEGSVVRMIAVFSYFEKQGVQFSKEERIGFYGRFE